MTPIAHSKVIRLFITNSAMFCISTVFLSAHCLTLNGKIEVIAGRKKTDKTNAKVTPIAVILPRSRNGGTSLKLRLKNPITVVNEVRKIG